MQKILQPLYFARGDTKTPFNYALAAMAVNAVLAIGLAPVIGWIATALATTVAGWAMMWLLARGARPMGEAVRLDDRFRRRVLRMTLAALIMGIALVPVWLGLRPWLAMPLVRFGALALLVIWGAVVYFGAGHLLGAFRLSDLRRAMRRS
jgi:putative peptidoglycan lipid II flippase